MSQPCAAPQLVLFDADLFALSDVAEALAALVASRGIARGAVSDHADIAARLDSAGAAQWFDFWLSGADDWPFARALDLAGVEPERVVLVSASDAALAQAAAAGLRPCAASVEELERLLP